MRKSALAQAIAAWFGRLGWRILPFQRTMWQVMQDGRSGLLHAPTGTGKTLAVWLGALQRVEAARLNRGDAPLTLLWLTPMRALAADTQRSLQDALDALELPWTVGLRTGDISSAERARQQRRLPPALVTTPESLSLLLARADAQQQLGKVTLVVVDEWHELLGNKRGVQVQLALARLRHWVPNLQVWGVSATLGNLDEAMDALLGVPEHTAQGVLVRGTVRKRLLVDTLLPPRMERFAWAGHLGLQMLPKVVKEIESSTSTLLFTNTRSQSEQWYQALLQARADWAGAIALHHGSLDPTQRQWVEGALKTGKLRAVVCTSSLDLGVDFLPVERVLQIGSVKGVGRLMQRAGRSGHAPGRIARLTLVPTHALELVEAAAARYAVAQGTMESRPVPVLPLDVLIQHMGTVALGGGFDADELLAEVRGTFSFRTLSDADWQWCLDFLRAGGDALTAYPDYHRIALQPDGWWRMTDARLARRHRMNIGTITSDSHLQVRYWQRGGGGGVLGTVEEGFVARLRPGDRFVFAGRVLELVRVHELTAYVRRSSRADGVAPRWSGGTLPLSAPLSDAMLTVLEDAAQRNSRAPEIRCARPLLDLQQNWSALPAPGMLLAETLQSREGWHVFIYPFAGRHVHLGLASLIAWRAGYSSASDGSPDSDERDSDAQVQVDTRVVSRTDGSGLTCSISVNDYGFELLAATPVDWAGLLPSLLVPGATLEEDVLASLNAGELALRRFREIARIAGLIVQNHPGQRASARHLQASSRLFFDVFRQYDPENRLLAQARAEVLSLELDVARLADTLNRLQQWQLNVQRLVRPSPFSFPLLVERMRERFSTETLATRVARMVAILERAAQGDISLSTVEAAVRFEAVPDKTTAARHRTRTSRGASRVRRGFP
jgi:ATP-dependent Lhr-like helicase